MEEILPSVHAVPALPDGRRAELHRVQPAWEILIQQQMIGDVAAIQLCQRFCQHRRSDKAGCKAEIIFPQQFDQAVAALTGIRAALQSRRATPAIQCQPVTIMEMVPPAVVISTRT